MGDRGNIKLIGESFKPNGVWFYTHWSGSYLKETVAAALARRLRWDDQPYLARIIFCHLLNGDTAGECGFGISASIQDNEGDRPIIVVDVDKQEVYEEVPETGGALRHWTFENFIKEFYTSGLEATPVPTPTEDIRVAAAKKAAATRRRNLALKAQSTEYSTQPYTAA